MAKGSKSSSPSNKVSFGKKSTGKSTEFGYC